MIPIHIVHWVVRCWSGDAIETINRSLDSDSYCTHKSGRIRYIHYRCKVLEREIYDWLQRRLIHFVFQSISSTKRDTIA